MLLHSKAKHPPSSEELIASESVTSGLFWMPDYCIATDRFRNAEGFRT
jgi:hypothetical protein